MLSQHHICNVPGLRLLEILEKYWTEKTPRDFNFTSRDTLSEWVTMHCFPSHKKQLQCLMPRVLKLAIGIVILGGRKCSYIRSFKTRHRATQATFTSLISDVLFHRTLLRFQLYVNNYFKDHKIPDSYS